MFNSDGFIDIVGPEMMQPQGKVIGPWSCPVTGCNLDTTHVILEGLTGYLGSDLVNVEALLL